MHASASYLWLDVHYLDMIVWEIHQFWIRMQGLLCAVISALVWYILREQPIYLSAPAVTQLQAT